MSGHTPQGTPLPSHDEDEHDNAIDSVDTPNWRERNADLRRRYSAAETRRTDAHARGDDDEARAASNELERIGDEFYQLNTGLAMGAARRFAAATGSLPDYAAAAALGLWEAFLRWDPEHGTTFGTFSRQYIAGRVQRAVRQVEFNHLTQHEFNLRKKIRSAQTELAARLERAPTHEEIAQAVGLTTEKVTKTLSLGAASLETPIGDGSSTLADLVADRAHGPLTDYDGNLDDDLDELSALELWITCARNDMYDGDNQSLVEIADTIGIGREIARRAETRGRLRIAAAQWARQHGRNPNAEELAEHTGKDLDHVNTYYVTNLVELKRRWRRICAAYASASTSSERARIHARLARAGEEVLSTIAPQAADLGRKRADEHGEPIGSAEATWKAFQAFLSWDEDGTTSYAAHARKFITAHTIPAKTQTEASDDLDVALAWTWISRQLEPHLARGEEPTPSRLDPRHGSDYADLRQRWHTAQQHLRRGTGTMRETATSELDRIGTSLLTAAAPLAEELANRENDGEPIGSAEAAWLVFKAFLAWTPQQGDFTGHARQYVTAQTSAPTRRTGPDPLPVELTWTWIRRQLLTPSR